MSQTQERLVARRRFSVVASALLVAALAFVPAAGSRAVAAPAGPSGYSVDAVGGGTPDDTGFLPVAPVRVLETRPGYGGTGVLAPFGTRQVNVTRALGVAPAKVAAVSLNVTVTDPVDSGYLTIWPGGRMPVASTLDFAPGATVPNGVTIGVDASGNISIFNGSPGASEVLVDLTGWIPAGAGFTAITPARVLDTRPGAPAVVSGTGPFRQFETRAVNVVGAAHLPLGQVGAVAVNLTVTGPTGSGYLTAYPTGGAVPPTSSVNFTAGQVVANSAVLGVGPTGTINVFAFFGLPSNSVHVVVDVTGWYPRARTFMPVTPRRLVDTRNDHSCGTSPAARCPLQGGHTYIAKIDGLGNLPRGFVGAVSLNITVTEPTAPGFLTVWPLADTTIATPTAGRPNSSFVNFGAGQTVANTVLVGLGAGTSDVNGDGSSDVNGAIGVFVNSGTAHVVIDLTGWFPQDTYGLVAGGVEARRYSVGTDRVAVVECYSGSPAGSGTAISGALAKVVSYYERLSEGAYRPQYTLLGRVALAPSFSDNDCFSAGAALVPPGRYDGALYVRDTPSFGTAYGLAGPGFTCEDVQCAPGTYPANSRDGIITLNTLLAVKPSLPGTPSPYSFIVAHEFGHMLDWPHSYTGAGGCWGGQYDNPVDLLSRPPGPGKCPSTPNFPTSPIRTIALNRYAAGWLSPSLVRLHQVSGTTYTIGTEGSGAPELLVVRSADGAAYTTLEARVGGLGDDDQNLGVAGIAVHRVDQRPSNTCLTVQLFGQDYCGGLARREQPFGPQGSVPDSDQHVLAAGDHVDLGGVTVTVVAHPTAKTFQVRVVGVMTAAFPLLPFHSQDALGTSVTSGSAVVCLVGTPPTPGSTNRGWKMRPRAARVAPGALPPLV